MPTGTLSGAGKKLWERVYNESKSGGDSEEIAARKAWAAIKRVGWKKDADGKWIKEKSELSEFSLVIKNASVDPKTGERKWRAWASDVDTDAHGDSMSLQLFADFIQRIESGEKPPAEYCSEFWSGGEPYLSISHYPDLDGEASPGISEKTYIDGKFLKARGRFFANPVGEAAYRTVKNELAHRSDVENPVRISIAFLDYQHQHKSTGTIYTRTDDDPVCMECLKATLKQEMAPKTYLRGHLIHYAMTRVPVNQRTIMEADMTTRKEDAESIVGESIAEELDEKAKLVGKSELVVKSDDETPVSDVPVIDPVLELVKSLATQVTSLTEVVRAMSDKQKKDPAMEDDEDMEECKACGGKGKMKKKAAVVEEALVDEPVEVVPTIQMLSEAFAAAMSPLNQRLDILIAAQSQPTKANQQAPQRRSINPADAAPVLRSNATPQPGQPISISEYSRRSVGMS